MDGGVVREVEWRWREGGVLPSGGEDRPENHQGPRNSSRQCVCGGRKGQFPGKS